MREKKRDKEQERMQHSESYALLKKEKRDGYHRRKAAVRSAGAGVYGFYRQLNTDWPAVPPTGLKVAVHPKLSGGKSEKPQLARLNMEQPSAGPSAESPVPTFIADPSLDLSRDDVRTALASAGVSKEEYAVAEELQGSFLDVVRAGGFGVDAVPSTHAPSEVAAPVPAWTSVPFVPSALAAADDADAMSILAAMSNMPPLTAGQLFSGSAETYSPDWETGVSGYPPSADTPLVFTGMPGLEVDVPALLSSADNTEVFTGMPGLGMSDFEMSDVGVSDVGMVSMSGYLPPADNTAAFTRMPDFRTADIPGYPPLVDNTAAFTRMPGLEVDIPAFLPSVGNNQVQQGVPGASSYGVGHGGAGRRSPSAGRSGRGRS
ncbi:hypothetical protein [Streptomyces sp. NPDC048277]|uniref:hypothetical protein n=1 Tax=Streptomyces sp. NPDC048277 TaxID=3155027 RepID=UPI0033D768D4